MNVHLLFLCKLVNRGKIHRGGFESVDSVRCIPPPPFLYRDLDRWTWHRDGLGELFHREEDPSRRLVIQPAATYPRRKRKKPTKQTTRGARRKGTEARSQSTGHDIVDESRRNASSSWLDRLVMSLNISVFEQHESPRMTSTTHPSSSPLHETSASPALRLPSGIGTGRPRSGSLQLAEGIAEGLEFRGNLWGGLIPVIPGVY